MKVKIGELTKIKTGKLDANASSEEGKYPFFTCSKEPLRISTYSYDCECVLVAGNGDLNVKYYNGKFDAYQRTYIIEDDSSGKLHMPYLYYFMESYVNELRQQAIGGVIKYIKLGNLTDALVELPPIDHQKAIVEILEKARRILDKRNEEMNALDDLIKARFVEMFGDPVSNPLGWEKKMLKTVCVKLNDGTHFSPESFEEGEYKYVTAKNIKESGFDFTNITYVSEAVHRPIYERCNPELGDVLYIKDGVTTGIAMVNTLNEEFTLLSSVALLKQNRKIMDGYFLAAVLNNENMYSNIRSNMGGAAITRLTIAKLNMIQIIVPPLKLQQQFANFVHQVDKSKVAVQKALEQTQTLFDSLMQKYFG